MSGSISEVLKVKKKNSELAFISVQSSVCAKVQAVFPGAPSGYNHPLGSYFTVLAFFLSCLRLDVSATLTRKLSLCHLAASGVDSSSASIILSLRSPLLRPPLLPLPWRREEDKRRVEETVDFACSKYGLCVWGAVIKGEKGQRTVQFFCGCVCVCVRVCRCD